MSLKLPTWGVGAPVPPKKLERPSDPATKPMAKPQQSVATVEDDPSPDDYERPAEFGFSVEVPDEIRVLSSATYLGDRDFILLSSAALLAQLPKEERLLRTTFVREYLYDFDPLLAAIRVGFLNVREPVQQYSPAMKAARALMAEPVVQRLIKECMLEAVRKEDAEDLVLVGLMREATNHGISGNASARNSAFKMLLDAIEKAKYRNNNKADRVKGNIMLMPPEQAGFAAWEEKAMLSQQQLKESVRV